LKIVGSQIYENSDGMRIRELGFDFQFLETLVGSLKAIIIRRLNIHNP
jgi:hypothetical protein